jgi:AraC family transcriptional regulator
MNRTETLHDHGARVQRAIAHMAANLDRDLDLETLSAVACFSPHHFHRIYRAVTGETTAETVRRLRLNRAAASLIQGTDPIAAVARRAGYGSVEAFTRAFAGMYGITPGAYRRRGRLIDPVPTTRTDEDETMYDVTIDATPAMRLAGLDHRGPYTAIGAAFDRLSAWAGPRRLVGPETRFLGLYFDDPETVPADRLRSVAAMTVGPEVMADGDVRILTLDAGPFARIVHKGPYAELEGAYRWLYRDWLPSSGREPADAPCFEEYLNDCRALPPAEWLTAIHLPLRAAEGRRVA